MTLPSMPFVGRTAELQQITTALRAALDGRTSIVIISGPAGIGKSRLVDASSAEAECLGFDVRRGRGNAQRHTAPLHALGELVRGDVGAPWHGAVGSSPDDEQRELRFGLIEPWVEAIERDAARHPLCLVIDDAHWLDAISLQALGALCRLRRVPPFALMLAGQAWPSSRERELFVDIARDHLCTELDLAPLTRDCVDQLVDEVMTPSQRDNVRDLIERAAGNPLLIVDVLAMAQRRIGSTIDLSHLHRSVLRRLPTLSDATMNVIRLGAVLGDDFKIDDLAALANTTAIGLIEPIGESIDAGILGDAGDRLGFRAPLIRDAVYSSIPETLRRSLHRRTRDLLEQSGAPAASVVAHVLNGGRPDDRDAVDWLRRSAAGSLGSAPQAAVELLTLAAQRAGNDDIAAVRAELAGALYAAGDFAAMTAVAFDGMRTMDDGHERWLLYERLAHALALQGRRHDLTTLVGDGATRVPSPQRARARAWLAFLDAMMVRASDARIGAAAATELLGSAVDEVTRCLALSARSLASTIGGDIDKAVSEGQESVARADRTAEHQGHRAIPCWVLALALAAKGSTDEAWTQLRRGEELCEELETAWALPFYHGTRALLRVVDGTWDDAVIDAEAALAVADQSGISACTTASVAALAFVAHHRGDHAVARAHIQSVKSRFDHTTLGSEWLALAEAGSAEAAGRLEEAFDTLHRAWESARTHRALVAMMRIGPELVRTASATGRSEVVGAIVNALDDIAATVSTPAAVGAAHRVHGLLADDTALLEAAVAHFDDGGSAFDAAVTTGEAGLAHARAGRLDDAVELLDRALAAFTALGARWDEDRLQVAANDVGLRRKGVPRTRPRYGWPSLTSTERQVVVLVHQGRTNNEIASQLGVSRRTIESHLYHIFAKLGITTRLELALQFESNSAVSETADGDVRGS